jgi:hypothetical protein
VYDHKEVHGLRRWDMQEGGEVSFSTFVVYFCTFAEPRASKSWVVVAKMKFTKWKK